MTTLLITFPFVLINFYRYIAPALYKKEKEMEREREKTREKERTREKEEMPPILPTIPRRKKKPAKLTKKEQDAVDSVSRIIRNQLGDIKSILG